MEFGGADVANAVALTPDGKIVIAGQGGPGSDMVVARLNADGGVDASFSPTLAGLGFVDFGGMDAANGVAVQPDGKVVLAGSTSAVGAGDVALARLDAAGALDPAFSDDGKLTLDYGAANELGLALALQQNGRIVVDSQGGAAGDFEVTRLAPDGSADTSFGTAGTFALDFGGTEFDGDVAVQPDGRIVTVGSTNVANGGDLAFARLEGDPGAVPVPPAPAPPPPADFTVGFADGDRSKVMIVPPGKTITRQIFLLRNVSSAGPVTLSVRKLPAGLTASISPARLLRPDERTATLRITADRRARPRYVKNGLITATPGGGAGSAVKRLPFRALVQAQLAAWVDGLEVTQGTQTDDQPRHVIYDGVRLMRGKKTVVRAFVDLEGTRPARAPGVRSLPPLTVALYGSDANGRRLPGSPLLPDWSPPASGLRRNQPGLPRADRESSSSAYVFVLPEQWTRGPITLLAKPIAPQPSFLSFFRRPEPLASTLCTSTSCGALFAHLANVNFFLPPKPRVISVVKVRYILNGKFTGDPVPAARAFEKLVALSPIPLVFRNGAGQLGPRADFTGVTTTSDGILEATKAWDDANRRQGDFVMGLFAYPPGLGYSPGPRAGVADATDDGTGHAQRPTTIDAHEVLHLLGLGHADTACGGSKKQTFPDPDGRMRSVGLDTTEGSGGSNPGDPPYRVFPDDPPTAPGWDLMSYCNLQVGDPQHWISARNWSALLGVPVPALRRQQAPTNGSFLVLRGRESGGQVAINAVRPSTLSAPPGAPSAYRLVARDAGGAVVADAPMSGDLAQQAGPAPAPPFTSLEGRVPSAGVARLEVVRDGAVVASIARSAAAPTARLLAPASGARLRGDRAVTVRWSVADADGGDPGVSLEYSADGGRTYATVAQGEGGGTVALPRGMLAASRNGRVRLRATDGFNTSVTAAQPVVVLPRAPAVTILEPAARQRVQGGAALYLRGTAVDDRGRTLPGRRLRWYAGRTRLGSGATLSAVLPAGARSVRLVARDLSGRTGAARVRVRARATTPLFLRLSAPRRLSRRARTLTLVVAATQPSTLRVGGQRHPVGRGTRRIRVRVRPGRSTLRLRAALAAGGRSSTQYVVVPRR